MTCSWLGTSALVADKLWDIAAILSEVGTVPYGRCCGRGGLSRCGFRIVSLAEMEAATRVPPPQCARRCSEARAANV